MRMGWRFGAGWSRRRRGLASICYALPGAWCGTRSMLRVMPAETQFMIIVEPLY
jgi:hypothetical protein